MNNNHEIPTWADLSEGEEFAADFYKHGGSQARRKDLLAVRVAGLLCRARARWASYRHPIASGQSKKASAFEAVTNVAVGYGVGVVSQWVLFPFFGVQMSAPAHMVLALWFTAISLARSYVLRRIFNRFTERPVRCAN
ncbi:MAG: hypothetical protein AB1405_03655 [Bdellovibrionota bacterium]